MRTFGAPWILLLYCSAGFGQQSACGVPVNVLVPDLSWLQSPHVPPASPFSDRRLAIPSVPLSFGNFDAALGALRLPNWTLARNLPAGAFLAYDRKRQVSVRSITIEGAPRRIVFVVENSIKMTSAGRRVAATVMSDILSKGRPGDSFALLTAGGPTRELPFGSSREALLSAADGLRNPPQGQGNERGVLDAVVQAVDWLQPPQAGDSIFLMAMHLEGKSNVSFGKARATLAAGPIRLFGFQFGSPELDYTGNPIGWVERSVQMFALSRESGGVAVLEDTEKGRQYQLANGRLEELRNNAQQMYSAVTNYYALQLDSISPHLRIELSPATKGKLGVAIVLYPWFPRECTRR